MGEINWQADIHNPFAMTIKLSKKQILLDGLLDLEVDFRYPSSYQLNVEEVLDHLTWSANPLTPALLLNQFTSSSKVSEEGIQSLLFKASLSPLKTGPLDISLLTVTFWPKNKTETPLNILTPVFNLQVLPLPSQTTPLSFAPLIPLEPQYPLDLTESNRQFLIENPDRKEEEKMRIQRMLDSHTFPWLTLVTLLGCGGIGWAAYLTRERWLKRQLKPKPALSPKEQADQALHALQAEHLLEQGLIQTYYAKLASILLSAIQGRVGWKTLELTTPELAQVFKKDSFLSVTQKEELLSTLAEIDKVKFAGKKTSREEAMQMDQHVQNLIRQLYTTSKEILKKEI
jgi:hypothetical protein